MVVTVFVLEIRQVEDYSDFDKLVCVIQYGLQGMLNIKDKSTEANYANNIFV